VARAVLPWSGSPAARPTLVLQSLGGARSVPSCSSRRAAGRVRTVSWPARPSCRVR